MAKKKEPHVAHPLTKRQLSHWQKQTLRQRVIAVTGSLVILAVVGVIVSGWYFKQYVPVDKPMHQTIVEVNGHKFNMAYYVDAIKYIDKYYYQGQTQYISLILDVVEKNIEQIELVKEEAAKLGFTISDDEVNTQIKNSGLDDNQAVRDIVLSQLLGNKLLSDYFGPKVPASAEQRDVLAMFVESQSQMDDIKSQIDAGADFGQLAADNSLESTTKGNKGDMGYRPKGVFDYLLSSTGLDDAIFAQAAGTWGEFKDADKVKQVGYWLVKVTEKKDDNSQVHVSGMLLSSFEEAQSIKTRLDAGEDFTALAEQYSQTWSDSAKDDMGWITTDTTGAYKNYVFDTATPVGAVSAPIKDTNQSTKGGYWLFKVVDSAVKDISSDDKTNLGNQAFNTWLKGIEADTNNKVTNYLDATKKAFASKQATG